MRIIDADAYAVHMENVLREALDKVEGKAFKDYVIASVVTGSIILDLRNDKITPTIDAVHVVRCKDCINRPFKIHEDRESNGFNLDARETNDFDYYCPFMCSDGWYSEMPPDDFYCKNGEMRKENEINKC